jgi:hypothetical protein
MIHRMGEAGLCLFMTSRRYADIEDSFCDAPSIEIIAHDDDIKATYTTKLMQIPQPRGGFKRLGSMTGLFLTSSKQQVECKGPLFTNVQCIFTELHTDIQ